LAAAESPEKREAAFRIKQLQNGIRKETAQPAAQQRSEMLRVYSEELLDAQREYSKLIEGEQEAPTQARIPSSAEIGNALASDQALLEYVVDKNQLSIFVVTRTGLHAISQRVGERDLTAKVQLLRDLVRANDGDEWKKPAASLYAILIGSLIQRGLLNDIHSLVLVPDGILNYAPFAVLARNLEGDRPRCLVEDYDLSVLPAAGLELAGRHHLEAANVRVLAMAPASSGLPFAVTEAHTIAKEFAPISEEVVGRKATETRFKESAPAFQIIHLATHGFFNKANPAFSGVKLEADTQNDGRLEVHEILQLRLNAQLVTLSACDTALGGGGFAETPAGDEFVAVDRAFLEAGSDAVLASLWKVNDHSTLILMTRLYREISAAGGPRALARAQRQLMRDSRYRAPAHWGAFLFIGKDFTKAQMAAER